MAHETVHLLNPMVGTTTNLEEGVAVAFSFHIQPAYGINVRPGTTAYNHAYGMVCHLPTWRTTCRRSPRPSRSRSSQRRGAGNAVHVVS